MIKQKINRYKKNTGSVTIFELLLSLGIITFFIVFPTIMFSYAKYKNTVDEISVAVLQDATTKGTVDDDTYKYFLELLDKKGYIDLSSNYSFTGNIAGNGSLQNNDLYFATNTTTSDYSTIKKINNRNDIETDATSFTDDNFYTMDYRYRNTEEENVIILQIGVPTTNYIKLIDRLYGLININKIFTNSSSKATMYEDGKYYYVSTLYGRSELYKD